MWVEAIGLEHFIDTWSRNTCNAADMGMPLNGVRDSGLSEKKMTICTVYMYMYVSFLFVGYITNYSYSMSILIMRQASI